MRFPWKYILISLAIGLLLGGALGVYAAKDLAYMWVRKTPEMFLKRLDKELHLSADQHTQILSFVTVNHEKIIAYEDAIRRATRLEIRALLTPEQQPRFDEMVARRDAERQKEGDR